jgi:hypothetical protein
MRIYILGFCFAVVEMTNVKSGTLCVKKIFNVRYALFSSQR